MKESTCIIFRITDCSADYKLLSRRIFEVATGLREFNQSTPIKKLKNEVYYGFLKLVGV